ncbi:MAG: glycosyltransferase family 2 protein, partial [Candidatus Eremiobacterota bacterium]
EIIDKINSLSADSEREINQKLSYLIRDENSNVQTLCSRLDKNIIPLIKDILKTKARLNEVEELLEFRTEQIEALIDLKTGKSEHNPYDIWIIKNEPVPKALEKQKNTCLPWSPVITVIALINKKEYLTSMIKSVISQTYSRWELILIHDAGDYRDERIKKAHTIKEAFSLCKGSFVTFINSSDRLSPFALFDILQVINKYPKSDFIYSDEDSISEDGSRHSPHFKPDWSPDTLRSFNYINHICLKKSLVDKVGTDYISDYDYILRASEEAKEIIHIPSILYHSRIKCINKEHDIKALKNHLERTGFEGNVEGGQSDGFYKVTYKIKDNPKISILIPTKDHAEDLKRCVTSVTDKSTYKNLEIIIIENGSSEKETFIFYDELKKKDNIKIIKWEKPFNYSACNNFVAASSTGDILLFLNNDTEVINPDWLERMIEHVQRKEVGAAGAKLYYPDNSVQHGGVIIDKKTQARHLYRHAPKDDTGYFGRLKTVQNVSAVTGACLMVKKEVFEEAGRFDEKFALAFNDTDLCLKIRQMGYLIVWTPYAELYHYECKTRGTLDSREKVESFRKEQELFHSRWISVLQKGDPYFSPHLTLKEEDFFLLKEEGERKIYSSVEIELKI